MEGVGYAHYDNNVPEGQPPRLIETNERLADGSPDEGRDSSGGGDPRENAAVYPNREGKINVSKNKNTITVRPGEGVDRVFGGYETGRTDTGSDAGDKEGGGLSEAIASQILTEKPDMMIPTDSGPRKAANVLSGVERRMKS